MEVIGLKPIKDILRRLNVVPEIEQGFRAYSEGRVVVPPVGEMMLERGEVHIKYGFIREDEFYIIKIASGFYQNPEMGLPSGNGLMLVFKQMTGEPVSILLDEGHLTDVRTAAAGAVAAKYLAPSKVKRIGIVGAGVQGKMQLMYLKQIVKCRNVLVWGINEEELFAYKTEMEREGFILGTTLDSKDILKTCNLIVTVTPSKEPVIKFPDLQPGTHITCIGSDTPLKQEVDPEILNNADIITTDSLEQCVQRGEIYKAIESGFLKIENVTELGNIISGTSPARISDYQLTVADLTGLAVQDIIIASLVYREYMN